MADLATPAGIGFEALNNILIGFYRAGAFDGPVSNEDVSSRTGLSADVITRNNGFFEELQILTREGPKHKLTEAGRDYAKYLHYGQLNDAKQVLARLINAWEPAVKLLDMIELKGPLSRPDLVAQIGMRAEVSIESARYSTGVNALIDQMLFAGLLTEGETGLSRVRPTLEDSRTELAVEKGESKRFAAEIRGPAALVLEEGSRLQIELAIDVNTDPEQVKRIIRAVRSALREDLDDRG